MPYITQEQRAIVDAQINALLVQIKRCAPEARGGILNYIITRMLLNIVPEPRYANYRSYVGDLMCCLLEFYRRHVGPYEDTAMQRNGDVHADNRHA